MPPKLRIARATNQLQKIAEMYRAGLGLDELGHFKDHQGFDGVMIGAPSCPYHFEFTQEAGSEAPRSPSQELLLVFYYPDLKEWESVKKQMQSAGFKLVQSHNPYWDQTGCTFEDPEGYRRGSKSPQLALIFLLCFQLLHRGDLLVEGKRCFFLLLALFSASAYADQVDGLYAKAYGVPSYPSLVFFCTVVLDIIATTFERISAQALADRGYYVVTFDQRGSGRSEKAPLSEYTYANAVKDVESVVQYYHLNNPIFLGHSWGGTLALKYAETFPNSYSAIVLVDAPLDCPKGACVWNFWAG